MKTITLGNTTIDRVVEFETLYFPPSVLYSNITQDMLARYRKEMGHALIHPETLHLGMSFHSFLIRTRRQNILVDTCNGNHKTRGPSMAWQHMFDSPNYMRNLAKLGLQPKDIDVVLCTHLHSDHVGWNTRLENGRWVPTFPNATYVISQIEFDHYSRLHSDEPVDDASFADSVLPIVEAGQAEFVEMNHLVEGPLDKGVWLEPSPGHTPGHVSIHVTGGGVEAIMTGDMIHHPIVFREPTLECAFDFDKQVSNISRQKVLERLADTNGLLLTSHFPTPTAGRICSCSSGFRFEYLSR